MLEAAVYKSDLNISQEELTRNIRNSLRYPQFQKGGERGSVAICAAGPSLFGQLPLLKALYRAGVPICAVKGTADILIAHGIIPKWAVFMDGKENQARFFEDPHPHVEYLISGQSHPSVFKKLKGLKVTVWHGEGRPTGLLPQRAKGKRGMKRRKGTRAKKGTDYVLGGSTTGLRAISIMWAKGFSNVHLFGFDCCASEKMTHVYDIPNPKKLLSYFMGLREFRATPQMAQQYNEFVYSYGAQRKLTFQVHGDGMIAEAWRRLNDSTNKNPYIGLSLLDLRPKPKPIFGGKDYQPPVDLGAFKDLVAPIDFSKPQEGQTPCQQ